MQQKIIEISCDSGLKNEFNKDLLSDFWLKRRAEYGLISNRALKVFYPFQYIISLWNWIYAMLAIKYKSKFELEPYLRLKLTLIKPDIEELYKSKQAQWSH